MDYSKIPVESNSKKSKNNEVVKKQKIQTIGNGKAVTKQKKPAKRLMESFIQEDIKNVKEYIITDIIIPNIKDAVSSAISGVSDTMGSLITGGVDMLLFGESRNRRYNRNVSPFRSNLGSTASYVSYNNPRSVKTYSNKKNEDRGVLSCNNDEIIFTERGDAEKTLDFMVDYMSLYHRVSLLDMYEAAGLQSQIQPTFDKYGWTDISNARVDKIRDGRDIFYTITLPKPIVLD